MRRMISLALAVIMCVCMMSACGKKKTVQSPDKIGGSVTEIGESILKKAGVKIKMKSSLIDKEDGDAFLELLGVDPDPRVLTAASFVPEDGSDKLLMFVVCTNNASEAAHTADRMYSHYMSIYEKNGILAAAAKNDIAMFVWIKPEIKDLTADDFVFSLEKLGEGKLEMKRKTV